MQRARVKLTIDYCSLIGRKNLDVNKVIAQEDRPSASRFYEDRNVQTRLKLRIKYFF